MRASADENEELFWALRGGGGNFGVVTALEFRLHEVGPTVFGGIAAYDPADGRTVGRAIRDYHADGAPDAAGLMFGYIAAPPEEFVPPEWQGKLVAVTGGMWNGPVTRASAPCSRCATSPSRSSTSTARCRTPRCSR